MGLCEQHRKAAQGRGLLRREARPEARQAALQEHGRQADKGAVQANGGGRSYDWINENQVKNVSKEKTAHPCQMPLKVMELVVGILPDGVGVIDPFCGSGTTLLACRKRGIPAIGIDMDQSYCEITEGRLERGF